MRTRGQRWVVVSGLSLVVAAAVTACGQSANAPQTAGPAPAEKRAPPPTPTGERPSAPTSRERSPASPPGSPAPAPAPRPQPPPSAETTLADYSKRCRKANREGQLADVEFQSGADMTRGETGTVALAVTLDRGATPAEVLGRPGATEDEGVFVACVLQARLLAPGDRFTVDADQRGWQSRSLETRDTARWLWQLTPTSTGSHAVSVELRPVVRIEDLDGTSREQQLREADVATYETTVHVALPAAARPAWWMRWTKGRVDDAAGLLESLAVLVGAAGGLWFALRHFNKRGAADRDVGAQRG